MIVKTVQTALSLQHGLRTHHICWPNQWRQWGLWWRCLSAPIKSQFSQHHLFFVCFSNDLLFSQFYNSNRWDCSMQKNLNNWVYDNRLLSGILLYLLNRVWDSVWFGANKCDLIKLATNEKIITGNVYAFFYEIVKIDWCKENFVIVE